MKFKLDLDLDPSVPKRPSAGVVQAASGAWPAPDATRRAADSLSAQPASASGRGAEGAGAATAGRDAFLGGCATPRSGAAPPVPVVPDLSLDLSPRPPAGMQAAIDLVRRLPVLRSVVSPDFQAARAGPDAAARAGGEGLTVQGELDAQSRCLTLALPETGLLEVPPGTRIVGDCRAPNVWVRGEVAGRVVATGRFLVVDVGARVLGGIDGAALVVVAGEVVGAASGPAVVARGRLELAGTARVHGAVHHRALSIHEGARIEGEFVGLGLER